jgi:hypothetical protein
MNIKGIPDGVIVKFLIVDVDGEAVFRFPLHSMPDGGMFEMLEAILASNPVLRLVDDAKIGDTWDGQNYVTPVE